MEQVTVLERGAPVERQEPGRPVLEVVDLRKIYRVGKVEVPALRGVNIGIVAGEFVSIMGPSGCGKSTLLHLLGGLAKPTSGNIFVDGTELTSISDSERTRVRREKMGFIFQRFNLLPTLTVRGNLEMARQIRGDGHQLTREDMLELLEIVKIDHKLDHKPVELSVGEQQRAAIARALVNKPAIILADEPTGSLDSRNSRHVLDLLLQLNRHKKQTIVMITHNPEAAEVAHRTIEMLDGQVIRSIEGVPHLINTAEEIC